MHLLPRARIAGLLDRARSIRVLVVGDLMLDRYVSGSVDRISPEAPVPVIRVASERSAVGGAGNVAANVLALGAGCRIVGCVGRDEGGRHLAEALAGMGADCGGIVPTEDRPTTVKTRFLARSQQVVRVDQEMDGDVPDEVARALTDAIEAALDEVDVVLLEDYNKGVLVPAVIRSALEGAARVGVPVVVDPKRLRFFEFPGVTVFKPNAKELGDALGESLRPEDPDWLEGVRSRLGCGHLLLTLGERGMSLWSGHEEGGLLRVPALARSVYDVSGAGDTVTAVMGVALAAGASPREAALLANQAAAIEVGKAGVATVSPEELLGLGGDGAGSAS